MSAFSAVPPPPASQSDGLGERILDVAIRLFASKGFAETSTREIAVAAGCTKPALYYHFDSKANLFRSAVELAHQRLDPGEQELTPQLGFREGLQQALQMLAQRVADNPDDLRLLFRADSYTALGSGFIDTRSLQLAHVAMAGELLAAGVAAGQLRADLPVEDAAISLIGMLHVHLKLVLDGRPLPPDFSQRIVSLFMDGVRA